MCFPSALATCKCAFKNFCKSASTDPRKCGLPLRTTATRGKRYVRKPDYHLKVLGGSDVEMDEHPWTVAVYLNGCTSCFLLTSMNYGKLNL